MILLGIDTGGTFTDFVLVRDNRLTIHKLLSTQHAPELAILQGIEELGLDELPDDDLYIVHGSTVATNAVLEGKVVRTAYVTNHGMRDILTLGRQARRELYNLQPKPAPPPVPRELCLETGGRIGANGALIDPLTAADVEQLQQQIEQLRPQAVAINLLFSYLDDQYEKQLAAAIDKTIFVSRSSEVLPEIGEYERGIATWLNAAVGPIMQGYLQRLSQGVQARIPDQPPHHTRVSVMQSSGGAIEAQQAARQAVHLLLSGPAGGMAGARYAAARSGKLRLLTFDMGGTSTDVALVDGELQLTNEGQIGPYPVAVPMVDIHTIGAGGGSIARVDEGGLLQVGPQSAGASPGPACYGRGGKVATVTDANLVLSRLRADAFLGGRMRLNIDAARHAVKILADQLSLGVEAMAEGIIRLADEHMARALRVMSVQRGIDPRKLTLVSFGGAGGLHVCALAEALSMHEAMVPVHAGVLSAMGMLVAPKARQLSQSFSGIVGSIDENQLRIVFDELTHKGRQALQLEGLQEHEIQITASVDVRYKGQSYTLNIPWLGKEKTLDSFHFNHELRYGHRLELEVEVVTARVKVLGLSHDVEGFEKFLTHENRFRPAQHSTTKLYGIGDPVPVFQRLELPVDYIVQGPALITETVSTTFVHAGWQCHTDHVGNLILHKASA
ncbi:MAG: hydantoinase/oxoprolinase family protein [Gammaproteobacteria bacterium]|nr:hydantoinase/oxoprolinase family protein [Gammaproteobacteria bacterium]